jgi:chromosome segregation ATPase
MIEQIMYFGGGFLVASLLAIILISFVHNRAVRLTQRRLADAIPVSMAEIQADKDHLRAEFALSARRLEMTVEQLKAKATAHLSEIARKTEAINLLKAELVEKTAVTDELAAKAKILGGKLTQTEQESLEKVTALDATAQALAAKDSEIANAANIINNLNHAADTQRVEVAVLKTQIEDLKSQIHDMQHATENTVQRLESEQSTAAGVHKDLYQARQTIEMLHPQVARLEHELAAHANELENRAAHIGELDARIAEHNQLLREREAVAQISRDEAAAAAERLRSAKTAVETQLQTANDMLSERVGQIRDLERRIGDFDRLVHQRDAEAQALNQEIATLKDEASAARTQWASEKHAYEARVASDDQTLGERAGRIADFERQVADFERLLAQRDADVKSLQQEIAVLREEAAAATAQWHGQKTSLDGQLAAARDTLAERAGRIEAFEQQVAEFERLVSQRHAEAQALHHEIAALKDEAAVAAQLWLADKASLDANVANLTGTSTEQSFRIEGFEQQVADFEQLVAKHEAQAKALQQEIVSLEEQAGAAEARWFAEKTSWEERHETASTTVTARTQRIGELETHVQELERLVSQREAEAQALNQEIAALKQETNAAAERWVGGKAAFEAQLANAGADLETRASRIGDLETWIAERQLLLQQREAELASLTQEIASLREQTATTEGRLLDANAALKSELAAATDKFTQAQAELAAVNREADATWRAERNENTVLRERISDIAAQIAHMTMTLEKSGSPIAAILADSANGIDGGEVTAPRPGNLTDRIRALQSGTSRVSTAS